MCYKKKDLCDGEVAEWLKAHAWKACKRETVSRVRIPLSPPFFYFQIVFKRLDYYNASFCEKKF